MKTDAILINAARDLRTKADNVVQSLNHRITAVDEARIRLENELAEVSQLQISPLQENAQKS